MINTLSLLGVWFAGVMGSIAVPPAVSADSGVAGPAVGESPPFASHAFGQAPPVRIWVEQGTDLFYPGDPVDLRFRTAEDAYVAIFHLDTDGNLDLVYPQSVWDQTIVRGQRIYSVTRPGRRFVLSLAPGIGYFYAVASPFPLDLRAVQARGGSRADGFGIGRAVRGDPFWALEQLTHLMVRDTRFGSYSADLFSYHVGGRHHFPSFACYDAFRSGLGDRYSYYPSCDRLRRLLVTYPYYYDTRRYRGDRAVYLREMRDLAPQHGFKEQPGRALPPTRGADPRGLERPVPRGRGAVPVLPQAERVEPEPATPARARPTLERRPAQREPERAEPPRAEPAPRTPPRETAPEGETPRREEVRPERRPPPGQSSGLSAEQAAPRVQPPGG